MKYFLGGIKMDNNTVFYAVITPCRNEEHNIEFTLKSVIAQTMRPDRWIIVDDGSTDGTAEIVKKYLDDNDWITLLELPDRGFYDLMEGGEIKAFYQGFELLKDEGHEYVAKLDGDISFEPDYFEKLLRHFLENPRLGIASGLCYVMKDEKLIPEKTHYKHPRGPARIYRRACWDEMGGVSTKLSWDAIDVYKARMLGWDTRNYPDIKAHHHVKTWKKGGMVHGLVRSGRLQYLMGSHPLFFSVRSVRQAFIRPYVLGAILTGYGYVRSAVQGEERVPEPELLAYIRKDQLSRLKPF